jgi:hypothetical protein
MAGLRYRGEGLRGRVKPEPASARNGVTCQNNAHDPAIGHFLDLDGILPADLFFQQDAAYFKRRKYYQRYQQEISAAAEKPQKLRMTETYETG